MERARSVAGRVERTRGARRPRLGVWPADEERRRLRGDASLSTEQRTAALERMVLDKEEALRKILGTDAYEQYRTGRDEADAGR